MDDLDEDNISNLSKDALPFFKISIQKAWHDVSSSYSPQPIGKDGHLQTPLYRVEED